MSRENEQNETPWYRNPKNLIVTFVKDKIIGGGVYNPQYITPEEVDEEVKEMLKSQGS